MIVTSQPVNKRVIFTFDDNEWDLVTWVFNHYGTTVFDELMANWMTGRTSQRKGTLMENLATSYKTATPAVKAQVQSLLGVTD